MSDVITGSLVAALGAAGDYSIAKLAGNANDNYLVSTADRKIVVKCLGEHTAENEQLEGQYRQYLHDSGLPVTPFLMFANSTYVYSEAGRNYVAIDYVAGFEARDKEAIVAESVARLSASFHTLDHSQMPKRLNWLDGNYLTHVQQEVQFDDRLVTELERQNASFPDFWDGRLIKGIAHGDLHTGNIIVDQHDTVVSLIDWEETGVVPIILDIAGTVQALAQQPTGFDTTIFTRFFGEYQRVRELTQAEKDIFPEAIRYRSFIVYVWALMKHRQGLMDENKMRFFEDRFYASIHVPEIA